MFVPCACDRPSHGRTLIAHRNHSAGTGDWLCTEHPFKNVTIRSNMLLADSVQRCIGGHRMTRIKADSNCTHLRLRHSRNTPAYDASSSHISTASMPWMATFLAAVLHEDHTEPAAGCMCETIRHTQIAGPTCRHRDMCEKGGSGGEEKA